MANISFCLNKVTIPTYSGYNKVQISCAYKDGTWSSPNTVTEFILGADQSANTELNLPFYYEEKSGTAGEVREVRVRVFMYDDNQLIGSIEQYFGLVGVAVQENYTLKNIPIDDPIILGIGTTGNEVHVLARERNRRDSTHLTRTSMQLWIYYVGYDVWYKPTTQPTFGSITGEYSSYIQSGDVVYMHIAKNETCTTESPTGIVIGRYNVATRTISTGWGSGTSAFTGNIANLRDSALALYDGYIYIFPSKNINATDNRYPFKYSISGDTMTSIASTSAYSSSFAYVARKGYSASLVGSTNICFYVTEGNTAHTSKIIAYNTVSGAWSTIYSLSSDNSTTDGYSSFYAKDNYGYLVNSMRVTSSSGSIRTDVSKFIRKLYLSVTGNDAGDTNNQLSEWKFFGTNANIIDNKVYYTLSFNYEPLPSPLYEINIGVYADDGGLTLLAGGYASSGSAYTSGKITLTEANSSGISGSVYFTSGTNTDLVVDETRYAWFNNAEKNVVMPVYDQHLVEVTNGFLVMGGQYISTLTKNSATLYQSYNLYLTSASDDSNTTRNKKQFRINSTNNELFKLTI